MEAVIGEEEGARGGGRGKGVVGAVRGVGRRVCVMPFPFAFTRGNSRQVGSRA